MLPQEILNSNLLDQARMFKKTIQINLKLNLNVSKKDILELDIEKYFDHINHYKL